MFNYTHTNRTTQILIILRTNCTGMDFAHVFNGYRYHTKYDHIDYLPPIVLQRTGDNVLALVKRIANSDELTNTEVLDKNKVVSFALK